MVLRQLQKKIYYYWRVLGTGVSFSVFGLGGPIIAGALAIFLTFFPLSTDSKRKVARKAIKGSFRLYINFMRTWGLMTYEVRGKEHMPKNGQLVVANHPTLLDVVFLFSMVDDANCIVRDGLVKNAFTKSPITAADFICNNAPDLIEKSIKSLASGSPLIVFPEGTRSVPGKDLKFKRGAANIAISAACDIAPVIIKCDPPTLIKHQKWYNIPGKRPHFVIEFRPALAIAPYIASQEPQCRVSRKLTRDLAQWFTDNTVKEQAA